jgi:tetratricopeptide (TPR) repeat protein
MPAIDSTGDLPPVSDGLPPVSAARPSLPGPPPEKIGPYKILEALGAGGMGVVYRAEQEQPRRQVALKVMKPGTASGDRLRRFEHEAQVLGRLQHEGIARIYEAGTADTGHGPQPYFAMELIQGKPLTVFADDQRLGTRERLGLIIRICQAVQYAHQKGVIHRDLKPANVLVNEAGQPRVLDFGVARVTDSDLLVPSLETGVGQLLGTLPYMSPEQAAADPEELDTRSDVYTLGVLCYQLLAGKPPHDLAGKPVPAAVRALSEEEPAPLGSVNRQFRGDLDTIVAKALEKDKARRYQTAADFAADLERYLRDEPVLARPAGAVYHFRKFARRNRALVGGVLAAVLALVAGTVATTWWALAAARAERRAQDYLADSYEQGARLASQRGAWREAIALIDKALATDRYRGAVPLRLNRVRALFALNDAEHYLPEIEALAAAPNLGESEGRVLLLQGDVLLGRDDTRALALIRAARQRGLPPGEDAYAEALLAETTPRAVAHLRRALQLDPYQPRARAMLELLLILLARLPEASLELSAHEALFPEDLNAKVLRALVLALERQRGAADAVLDGLRGQLAREDLEALHALAGVLAELRNPAIGLEPDTGFPDLKPLFPALLPALAHLWATPPGGGRNDVGAATQAVRRFASPLPPLLRNGLVRLLQVGEAGDLDKLADELSRAAAVHPEGTLLYVRAMALFGAWRFEEAEKVAREAAETPALLPVRRSGLCLAFGAKAMLLTLKWSRDPVAWRRPIEDLRLLLAEGASGPPLRRDLAIGAAMLVREFTLARRIVEDWEREAPADPKVLGWRAKVELRAGNSGAAIEAADRALERKPGDAEMLRIKKEATDNLTEQFRRLVPAAPDRTAP